MPTKAYSYIRISTKEQRKGRGEERQLEAAQAYAAQHGLDLDDSLRDLGKSGFHGDHVKSGALGRFLDLVAAGQIAVGSYLLVENLDRLSRQTPIDAQAQFIALLQAGIRIVTLTDGQVYERGRDFTQMIISLTIMSRGHEESARKSYNSKKNADALRKDMLAGLPRFLPQCVGWIDQTQIPGSKDCKFTLNDHAKTVQRIFELSDQGVGPLSIARLLNEAKTPPLKAVSSKWWETTIIRILKNETAIGTLQVNDTVDGKLVPLGDPIPKYYPAAVSEELFWRVQRNRPKTARTGRKGLKYANLFQMITRCVHCHGGLGLVRSTRNDFQYYRCKTRYEDKTCPGPSKMYPYTNLENAILDHVTDFYLDSQLGFTKTSVQRQALVDEAHIVDDGLLDLEKRRKNAMSMAELADDDQTRSELMSRIRQLRGQIEQQKSKSNELHMAVTAIDDQSSQLNDVSDMIAAERALWKTGTDEEIFISRSKVAQSIKRFVSQIQVDFAQQTATVYVAGYTRMYFFDRLGTRTLTLNSVAWPWAKIEAMLVADGASEEQIAKAKDAHLKLKAAA
ncbi:recombinase family protein [Agrobacterium fabrum]|uniref:recombinase family protein n=1 Tax=Agrobacterium fabrum TaxID=1176649 RepID=UPI0021CF45FC|nr:recombinase family protein [Agrobacterium fabrum]UXT56700.1 recombinase family protein [Agrobacterium fabrum]